MDGAELLYGSDSTYVAAGDRHVDEQLSGVGRHGAGQLHLAEDCLHLVGVEFKAREVLRVRHISRDASRAHVGASGAGAIGQHGVYLLVGEGLRAVLRKHSDDGA